MNSGQIEIRNRKKKKPIIIGNGLLSTITIITFAAIAFGIAIAIDDDNNNNHHHRDDDW